MSLKKIKLKIKKNKYLFIPLAIAAFIFRKIASSLHIASETIYSIAYYQKLNIQNSNHFTIGVKKLVLARTKFPHPVGIVIGKGVSLGYDCQIYQNVTIGLRHEKASKYPKIGNNVTIYANSVIIGDIEIGDNSIIGASTVLTQSVPPNSIVAGSPGKVIKTLK